MLDQITDSKNVPRITSEGQNQRKTIRAAIAFIIGTITSPCCIPLIVPIILALLAGTPLAVWITEHLGWVYAILILISVTSLVTGLMLLRRKNTTV